MSDVAIRTEQAGPPIRRLHRRRRRRPRDRRGRDLRLPRPERRRQVDDRAHAVHAAGAHERARPTVAGYDVASQPGDVRLAHRRRAAGRGARPEADRPRAAAPAGPALRPARSARWRKRVDELGELIDLGDALDRPIGTYSGGMKRRLDLAAALVHNPEILFLDEPTTGLDPVSRASVWDEVRRLNDELGMTIFLTTQYLEEADELCDRVGIIDHGRIVAEGTPDELKRTVGTDVIVARVDGDAAALVPADRGARRRAGRRGARQRAGHRHRQRLGRHQPGRRRARTAATSRVRDLTLRTPTLDDVFLELTGSHIERERRPTRRPPDDRRRRRRPDHAAPTRSAPDPAGFVHDVAAIAGRALRAVPRDLEAVIPPVFIALFFFVVNIATLQKLTQSAGRRLRLQGVPDADGDPARRHRRLPGAGARARRAGRLPRPAAADAGPAPGDPARPHGRRRDRGRRR